ncbi:unnamed protein product, partial [Phaeothamnion confervicola]
PLLPPGVARRGGRLWGRDADSAADRRPAGAAGPRPSLRAAVAGGAGRCGGGAGARSRFGDGATLSRGAGRGERGGSGERWRPSREQLRRWQWQPAWEQSWPTCWWRA